MMTIGDERRSRTFRRRCGSASRRFSAGLLRSARRASRFWRWRSRFWRPSTRRRDSRHGPRPACIRRKPSGAPRGPPVPVDRRGAPRPEVRRHVGRRSRPHPGRRRPHRAHPQRRSTTSSSSCRRWARRPTTCCGSRTTSSDRPGGPGARHAAHRGRAHLDRAAVHGDRWTSASPAVSFTGSQAGIVTDTEPRQGQDRRGPGRPHPRGARRGQASRSSPASRACRPTATSRRSAAGGSDTTAVALAAALGRRGVRDLHRRRRASTPPIRGSSRPPGACPASRSTIDK